MRKIIVFALILFGTHLHADKKNILVLRLSQSHFTLDIWEHVKDSANTVEFEIPVDKEFYDSVKKGDQLLKDRFRVGSFIVRGSIGNWNLVVVDKK